MNKAKKLTGVAVAVMGIGILAGCEEPTLVYQGVERPQSQVAEIISDQLEVENPSLDIEVTVGQGADD